MGRFFERTVRAVGATSTAALALILADACAVPAGDAMMRAGEAMIDAGAALGDDDASVHPDGSSLGEHPDDGPQSDAGGSLLADAGAAMRDAGAAVRDAGMAAHDAGSEAMAQVASLFRSGSRIEVRVAISKGADGSQSAGYPSLFDTQIGAPCSVSVTVDGKQRCVPTGAYVVYYADANCTTQLAYDTAPSACGTSAPSFARLAEDINITGCAVSAVRVFRVGAAHTGKVYGGAPNSCVDVSGSVSKPWRPYRLGAEVPAASFVEFTDAGHEVLH